MSQEMAFSPLGAIFELGQTETNGLTSRTTALLSKAEVARNRGKSAKGVKLRLSKCLRQTPKADLQICALRDAGSTVLKIKIDNCAINCTTNHRA